VKQHGGYIYVFSEEEKGTQFQIFLPPCDMERRKTPERPPAHAPGGTETVLVAEDDASTRRWVVEAMRQMGYTVLQSSSADDALEVCEGYQGPIHLLLTDIVMPRMSGTELAERFQKQRPEGRIVFMSGYPEKRITHLHLTDSYRTPFLEKPLTLGGISRGLREALDAEK
jgi:CheY-like chemotaxis protein